MTAFVSTFFMVWAFLTAGQKIERKDWWSVATWLIAAYASMSVMLWDVHIS